VVASVDVLGADGTVETITGTTIHPVWSVDRQEWVPLAELVDGERLQGLDGLAVVLGVSLSRVSQAVYNIEVHGEHVYQVGELGVLVHNSCPVTELAPGQVVGGFMTRGGELIGNLFTHGGHADAVLSVSGLTTRLKNGSAIAFSVGKRTNGIIDVFPSGTFPVSGGFTEAMKEMALKFVR
jgi:hypothetical protein